MFFLVWSSFASGVLILNLLDWQNHWWTIILLSVVGLFYLFKKNQFNFKIKRWYLIFFILLILRIFWVSFDSPKQLQKNSEPMTATISQKFSNSLLIKNRNHNFLLNFWQPKKHLLVGQQIRFCGKYENLKRTPKQLNYYWWMRSYKVNGIYRLNNKCQFQIINHNNLRLKVWNWLLKNTNFRLKVWIKWMLFQNPPNQSEKINLYEKTQRLGIVHIFTISGFHLIVSGFIVRLFLKKIKNRRFQLIGNLLILMWMGWIVYLTNFKITTIKAWLLILCGTFLKPNPRKWLIFVFLGFLFYWPLYIWQTGFQISFCASFCLLLIKKTKHSKNVLLNHLIGIIKTTCLITFAIIPIIIKLQNGISLTVFLNLFVFTIWGTLVYPLFFVTIWFKWFTFPIWNAIFKGSEFLIHELEKINYIWWISHFQIFHYLIYYAFLIIAINDWKVKRALFLWTLLTSFLLFSNWIDLHSNQHKFLHMIDVGHGLAMLIHMPNNGAKILLDAGIGKRTISYNRKIINYLQKQKINVLDAVFISHNDYDHKNNLIFLQNRILIKKVFTIKNSQANYKIKKLHFFNLNYRFANWMKKNNNKSLVLLTQIYQKWLLFSFDIEYKVEKLIIKQWNFPKIDILQVAHHGSNTSSSLDFLTIIKPKYCLISNQKIVIKTKARLQKFCQVFETRKNGNLAIVIRNQKTFIKTEY